VRVIVLLLAVIMMTGTAVQVATASPDVASEIDDAPDVGAPVMQAHVAVPVPGCRGPIRIEAPPASARGRMHAVLVFRPPRLVASR
jgi:hypothetical protein